MGYAPYLWQIELAERLYNGDIPERIDVPTGLGKSSVVDAHIYALGCQLAEIIDGGRTTRSVPMRLHFVVDRRVIVTQAYDHAAELAATLETSTHPVAAAFRAFADDGPHGRSPLVAAKLLGGPDGNLTHIDVVDQPAVIATTIDQLGARLLYRAYGLSSRRRSFDAALVGADSLIVVDEAHLAAQFLHTLGIVGGYTASGLESHVVEMSATPPASNDKSVLSFDRAAETAVAPGLDRCLRNRDALEITALRFASSTKDATRDAGAAEWTVPGSSWAAAAGVVARSVAGTALASRSDETTSVAVGVFCNRVVDAIRVAKQLAKNKPGETPSSVLLLHGSLDPVRRERALERLAAFKPRGKRNAETELVYVVATQTIEAGADVDLDAAVTASCPLDALRQRLGRVNRLGLRPWAEMVVLHEPLSVKNDKLVPDRLYGLTPDALYRFLTAGQITNVAQLEQAWRRIQSQPDGTNVPAFTAKELIGEAPPPRSISAPEFRDYLQTSTVASEEPPVGAWLRHNTTANDVTVLWRSDLDAIDATDWPDYIRALPPSPLEGASLPLGRLWGWLDETKKGAARDTDGGDVGDYLDATPEPSGVGRRGSCVRISRAGRHQDIVVCSLGKAKMSARAGDVLVLPLAVGGCDEFGWNPESRPPARAEDADLLGIEAERTGVVRGCVLIRDPSPELQSMVGSSASIRRIVTRPLARAEFLERLAGDDGRREFGAFGAVRELLAVDPRRVTLRAWTSGENLWIALAAFPNAPAEEDDAESGESSFNDRSPVAHATHSRAVRERATAVAQRVGAPEEVVAIIAEAAARHDWGKSFALFQRALCYQPDGTFADSGELRAKSGLPRSLWSISMSAAGVPHSFRHEALSVALSDAAGPGALADPALLCHLIGIHHGGGRALFPPCPDLRGLVTELAYDAGLVAAEGNPLQDPRAAQWGDWVRQFHQLNASYGPYCLSLFEAVLISSDWQCSREGS
jgi:CRISPR-associated endonuclease/helicase Cas3